VARGSIEIIVTATYAPGKNIDFDSNNDVHAKVILDCDVLKVPHPKKIDTWVKRPGVVCFSYTTKEWTVRLRFPRGVYLISSLTAPPL
jgi:hypothetical protein